MKCLFNVALDLGDSSVWPFKATRKKVFSLAQYACSHGGIFLLQCLFNFYTVFRIILLQDRYPASLEGNSKI